MSIERAARRTTWTQVDNRTVNDERLSFRALGLLVYILSKPDHWTTNRDHLASVHQEGVAAIRATLSELEACGYLERIRERGPDGRIQWRSVVHEVPAEPTSGGFSADGLPSGGGSAVLVRPEAATTEKQSVERDLARVHQGPLLAAPPAVRPANHDLAFAAFWEAYPRRVAKGAARKAWDRALRRANGDPAVIVAAARQLAQDPNREQQFTPYPATWLNADRWLDEEPLPERTDGMNRTERALRRVQHFDPVSLGQPGPRPFSIAAQVFNLANQEPPT